MVTDSHSEDSILLWLRKWLSYVDAPPSEIITDDSSALVSACIQAFTLFCTTKSYLTRLFSVLEGSNSDKPKAFIRLDTSHFIKTLHNLACFKTNIDSNVKYFYIRCIIFLKQCENYELPKEVIQNVVNLCLSQYDDEIGDFSIAKSRLDKLLHNVTLDGFDSESKLNLYKKHAFDVDINNEDLEFIQWFNNIVQDTKKRNPILKNNKNAYYCPPFITTFRRILMKLPLWSNLLRPLFESENKAPSSSGVESYFKTLKHLVFKTKFQRYRIDEFFQLYAEYLEGEMKSALCSLSLDITNKINPKKTFRKRIRSDNLNKQSHKKKQKVHKTINVYSRSLTEDSIFSDQPSYIENWKGQGKVAKLESNMMIKFIRNGNLCPSVYNNSNYVKASNTCSFDSVMYLMGKEYKENGNIKNIIDAFDEKELIPQYIKCLSDTNCKDDDIYKLRAQIITHYIDKPTSVTSQSCNYDVACNVTYIYEHFLLKYFNSYIFTKMCSNKYLNITKNNVFLPLNIDMINIFDISLLEEAISLMEGVTKCAYCQGIANSNYVMSNLISFDLNGTKAVALEKVPKTIIIKNKMYRNIGAVEFVPPSDVTGIGHYKAHYSSNDFFFAMTICAPKFMKALSKIFCCTP